MKGIKIISALLVMSTIFTGCGNKKANKGQSVNPEAEVCSFDDFQYLMFTENGKSVIRDEKGEEYILESDGYYRDNQGNKILTYGVGDITTYKLGDSTGAISKSEKSGVANNIEANSEDSISPEKSEPQSESVVDDSEQHDTASGEYEDTTIGDWDSIKSEIINNTGITPTTEAPWHGRSDDLESCKTANGSGTLVADKSYNTAINLGTSIPATLNIQKIIKDSTCTVTGTLTLDAEAFNEYMCGIYGDTQINEEGEEVPANYALYLQEQYCSFSLIAKNDMQYLFSDPQNLYFDENYTVNFNLSLSVPEGYTPYLSIQDVSYNI